MMKKILKGSNKTTIRRSGALANSKTKGQDYVIPLSNCSLSFETETEEYTENSYTGSSDILNHNGCVVVESQYLEVEAYPAYAIENGGVITYKSDYPKGIFTAEDKSVKRVCVSRPNQTIKRMSFAKAFIMMVNELQDQSSDLLELSEMEFKTAIRAGMVIEAGNAKFHV